MKEYTSSTQTKVIYSDDNNYRYSLKRTWQENGLKATFIGINPSEATELMWDTTVMNLNNHLVDLGYGSVEIVNLFSYRSKQQKTLTLRNVTQERYNLKYIKNAIQDSEIIIIGWGRDAEKKSTYRQDIERVKNLLVVHKEKVYCFMDGKGNVNCHLSRGYNKDWKLIKYEI